MLFRIAGKYLGAYWGAKIAKADSSIVKHMDGGLIPQAGIVIGLVLNVYKMEAFGDIAELLLGIGMGTTIINELLGPVMTKYSLRKAGEIKKKSE
ncbi:hypothetical protein [Saccharicrinis sp. 156]|uniref:hypothetical protein n=1 Tax=Saccharicrinis sp. 156 TaxID=3417574 RepID=UPI003D351FA7